MRIAVIGSGALGLYYGALLQRAGNDVRFLLRRDYDAISRGGLAVTSPDGDFRLDRVQGFRRTDEMGEVDLVVVGLKTFDNDRLVELCRPLMRGTAAVLTLQNGLGNEELLAGAFGADRVLGGVAFLGANRGEPGTVHHLGKGHIRLGGAGLRGRRGGVSEAQPHGSAGREVLRAGARPHRGDPGLLCSGGSHVLVAVPAEPDLL